MIKNKTKLLTLFSLGLLLSACTKKQTTDMSANNSQQSMTQEEAFSKKSTIKDLLGMGKNLTCTYDFSDPEGNIHTKGKVYISNKKFATDIETTDPSDKQEVLTHHMISDGDYIYTWSDDERQAGMKMKIENSNETNTQSAKTDVAGAKENMEAEYNMNCSPWIIDQNKFALPNQIKFTDLSEMMKNIPAMPSISQIPNLPGMSK